MRTVLYFLIFTLGFAVSGCASTSDLDELEARVTALESRADANASGIAALEARVDDATAAADRSADLAAQAEAAARGAETRASDAARKADAIFKKSVSK